MIDDPIKVGRVWCFVLRLRTSVRGSIRGIHCPMRMPALGSASCPGLYDAIRTLALAASVPTLVDSGEIVSMRPYIICRMVTSIDGRIHPSRFTVPAVGIPAEELRRHYERVTGGFKAEGWIERQLTPCPLDRSEHQVSKAMPQGGSLFGGRPHTQGHLRQALHPSFRTMC
jgi:hypothetical protein